MKTNVAIDLTDEDRDLIATIIDGKQTKRLATRSDIVTICQRFIQRVVSGSKPESVTLNFEADQPESVAQVTGSGPDAARCPSCESVQRFDADGQWKVDLVCESCGENFSAHKRGDV